MAGRKFQGEGCSTRMRLTTATTSRVIPARSPARPRRVTVVPVEVDPAVGPPTQMEDGQRLRKPP